MTPTDVAVMSTTTRRRTWLCRLLVLPVALLLAAALAAPALAAEGLSTYKHTETTPKQETAPEKTSKPPAEETKEPEHVATTTTPSSTPAPAKQSTLPFTGFDLRWTVGFGLLLMGAGFSIVVVQRRQRRSGGR